MSIEIDGVKYKVIENLGFDHSRGQYAKVVLTENGENIAVRYPGSYSKWQFSRPNIIVVERTK